MASPRGSVGFKSASFCLYDTRDILKVLEFFVFLFFFKKRTDLSPDPYPSLPLLHNLLIQNVLSRQPTGWTRSKPRSRRLHHAPSGSTTAWGGRKTGWGVGEGLAGASTGGCLSAPQFKVVSPTSCHVTLLRPVRYGRTTFKGGRNRDLGRSSSLPTASSCSCCEIRWQLVQRGKAKR